MKVSVAICTYNGERYLNEQIVSILNQTRNVDEIIVCDDISSDKTIEILNNYSVLHPNLFKIHINETNLKSVKNFEKAISLASGDVIFLADQDDKWISEKVEKYLEFFESNSDVTVIASNGYLFNENSKNIEETTLWDIPKLLKAEGKNPDLYKIINFISNIATGASMAIRKEFVKEVVPFPVLKGFHHDHWVASIALVQNSFLFLDDKYFYYRIHSSQQVGGVSFKSETKFLDIYNFGKSSIGFYSLNKRIRKLYNSQQRNEILEKESSQPVLIRKISTDLKIQIDLEIKKISNQYPIRWKLTQLFNLIFNKKTQK